MSYMGLEIVETTPALNLRNALPKLASLFSRIGSHISLWLNLYDSEVVKSREKVVNHRDWGESCPYCDLNPAGAAACAVI